MNLLPKDNDELKGCSNLLAHNKNAPCFVVPDNYFDDFSKEISTLISLETFADKYSKENPYEVPKHYFETFAAELVKEIQALEVDSTKEIEELSPLLAQLKSKETYQLPSEDYFEQDLSGAKVISMPTPSAVQYAKKKIKWMRWIAAAAIMFIFFLGGYTFLINDTSGVNEHYSVASALSDISDEEIQEFLIENDKLYSYSESSLDTYNLSAEEKTILNSLSDQDIEDLLGL